MPSRRDLLKYGGVAAVLAAGGAALGPTPQRAVPTAELDAWWDSRPTGTWDEQTEAWRSWWNKYPAKVWRPYVSMRIRRGGGTTTTPPPPVLFGPLQGAAAVRAGVGPRTVTNPGTGISFNSSGSLQTAIANNPTSSIFVCSVTNPLWNGPVVPGTKRPTIIFPGSPGQTVINGQGGNFNAVQAGDGTTIRGGHFTNFGATIPTSGIICQDDVTLQDVELSDVSHDGIGMVGLNTVLDHCSIHDTGTKNLASAAAEGVITSMTVDACDIYNGNTRLQDAGFDASGSKMLYQGHSIVRNSWFHDNHGFGLWFDTNNFDCLIENNVLEDNEFGGLMYEANYGSVIRNNYIANNGRNITIGSPPTVANVVNVRLSDNACSRTAPDGFVYPLDFHSNLLDHTLAQSGQTGALIQVWDHTDTTARHASNHNIHHNQFWCRFTHTVGGAPARIRNVDEDGVLPLTTNFQIWSQNVSYNNNQYRTINNTTSFWMWATGTATGSTVNFSTWQGFHPTGETRILI